MKELELEWELNHWVRNVKRFYKTEKHYKDPRKTAIEDFRHHRKTKYFYSHECKYARVTSNRRFRLKMKHCIYKEEYYKPIPHDYKSYGWLS